MIIRVTRVATLNNEGESDIVKSIPNCMTDSY